MLRVTSEANAEDAESKSQDSDDAMHLIPLGRFRPGIDLYDPFMETPLLMDAGYQGPSEAHVNVPQLDLWRWTLAARVGVDKAPLGSLVERTRNVLRFDQAFKQWPLYIAFAVVRLAYGGLHCLAWDAPFSTDLERISWRVSSVTVTSIGALIALGFTWTVSPPIWLNREKVSVGIRITMHDVLEMTGIRAPHNKVLQVEQTNKAVWVKIAHVLIDIYLILMLFITFAAKILFDRAITALILFYIVARVYLAVESSINVAHLSDGAYQMPHWAQYVPHIA